MTELPIRDVVPAHRFDEAKLAEWMAAHVAGYVAPLRVQQFQGGASNPTFLLTAGDGHLYVLRKKPPGQLLSSAHQVDREYRAMKALAGQIADLTTESTLVEALRTAHRTCESHIEALSALAKRREIGAQGISEVVKRAAAGVLGIGAAAVDFVRGEKVAKNLRDDYAALSLAVIGYVMLYTVGMSLGDHEVARDYRGEPTGAGGDDRAHGAERDHGNPHAAGRNVH